jgi:hypothetical protein
MRSLIVCAILSFTALPVRADVIPMNSKPVEHVLRFENLGAYPDHAFFLVSFFYNKSSGTAKLERAAVRVPDSGEVPAHGTRAGPFVYYYRNQLVAVPVALLTGASEPSDEFFMEPKPGVLRSEEVDSHVGYIPRSDRRDRFVSGYRATIDGDQLRLERTHKEAPVDWTATAVEGPKRWVMIAGGLALAGLVVLIGMIVLRGRKAG